MAQAEKFDLIVMGCGPAGEKGAAQVAYFGKKVAVIERATQVGGSGINTGTVPSKTLRESALYFSGLKQRGLYGIDYSLRDNLKMADFMHHLGQVVEMERRKILKNLDAHKIELIQGQAGFEDAHTVSVAMPGGRKRLLTAEVILIATGSKPNRPADVVFDDKSVFDSDTILRMDRIPKSMIVVGGGVIGSEYGSIFQALGVQVILTDGRDRLLTFLDAEMSEILRQRLAEWGMDFYFNDRMEEFERTTEGVRMRMKSGQVLEAETILFAAGRAAAVDSLHLERAGLCVNKRGYIEVDEHYKTSADKVYAAGDVIGSPALASTSMEQARVAMCHAFGFAYKQRVASMLPMGIYTIPEISSVGDSEEDCKKKEIDYFVGVAHYGNNARGQICGDTNGKLKLIFSRSERKLLGVHIIGEQATELIHLGLMSLYDGDNIDAFIEICFNYPTLSEMYKYAAYDGLGNLAQHKLREG
ncbi:MAG TPA: Si-specific NAD(P)(+) transhydrogenase [Candidatus Acidoferrales bacterium]|nr:Si-specific NAD(P)(+) transhydrogenase [Candidatus Acidoferrales bacterium]